MYLQQLASQMTSSNEKLQPLAETYHFTEREVEIVKLLLEDCSNLEIDQKLSVAEITVKKHMSNILKKTEVKNRVQLILKDFSLVQTRHYLKNYDIKEDVTVRNLWSFTSGHPLTLSLAAAALEESTASLADWNKSTDVLSQLLHIWLKEVVQDSLYDWVEAAAILHHFDQSNLSFILHQDVPISVYDKLISLSFVEKRKQGWAFHDLIRDVFIIELKQRNPERYPELSQQCELYDHQRISKAPHSTWDIAQFFYHLGNEFIQSAFFQGNHHIDRYLELVGPHNFDEVVDYFNRRKSRDANSEAIFYNRTANTNYQLYASAEYNAKENELVHSKYVLNVGYESARLLKNAAKEALGISIVVPINQKTIQQLVSLPVSRTYFSNLSNEEFKEYSVPENENSGWYIRLLDCLEPEDATSQSYLLHSLFPLLLSGGRIITSTPVKFYKEVLHQFGFEEIPRAEHEDFGLADPTPTYILDVRGPRLAEYLQQLAKLHMPSPNDRMERLTEIFSFTEREKEIVELILDEYSNENIAKKLALAEITVKKHVSKILKKTDVKNRAQLIKRVMERYTKMALF
jgi:DNA-binding NarL/FixJ family response regulator